MKNLSFEAVNLLRKNARRAVQELGLLNNAYSEIDVTLAERHLLIELNACESSTASGIKERLLLDKSTVSRLISRAVKKSYVESRIDEKDKRNRLLFLTDKGRKTLNAFETTAFKQTKDSLLTLTSEEIETVYQGVALYAQGLKNSRLVKKNTPTTLLPISTSDGTGTHQEIESMQEITKQMNKLGYELRTFDEKDEECLYQIFQEVVDVGTLFPYECSSTQEFHQQFLNPAGQVYVCCSSEKEVVGGFYLRPNFSGRSSHIVNAAYMMRSTHRGKGIGALFIKASLHLAKSLGFEAMQFNMVLSQNLVAIRLYQRLGFSIIGTIPEAVRKPDGGYQDGYVMYRKLNDF